MSDFKRLLELTEQVPLPVFDDLLALQTRRARRTRAAVAVTTAAAVVATIAVLALSGTGERTQPPPVDRTPTPSPTFAIPAGQRTISADIRPGDIHGYDVLAHVTNRQPEHRGASYLEASATVHVDGINVTFFCRGGSDLWLVTQRNGGYGLTQCSPNADTGFRPREPIDQTTPRHLPQTVSATAYVARPGKDW